MAIVFNSSHALAGNVLTCIGVNPATDAVIDFKTPSRELTPDASVVIGTGTYGKHFATVTGTNKGIALANLGDTRTAIPNSTRLVVFNALTGSTVRASFYNQGYQGPTILLSSTGKAGAGFGSTTLNTAPISQGTTTILNTGAHSVALTRTGTTAHEIFVDGVSEASGGQLGGASTGDGLTHIGGYTSYGSVACQFVWYVVFDKVLSPTEISDLQATLGADGAFGLVYEDGIAPDVTPPVITLTGASEITLNEGDAWSEPGYSAIDDTDGDITANVVRTVYRYIGDRTSLGLVVAEVDTSDPETYTIEYTVMDAAGNSSLETRTVIVTDLPGARGADIPTTGLHGASVLADKPTLPADNNTIFYAELITPPTVGTFRLFADGSFVFDAPNGAYSFQYQLYVGGVATGSPETVSLLVGENTVALDSGSVAVTGTSLGLLHGFSVLADSDSYAVTGSSVGLLHGHLESTDSGSYAVTGSSVGILYDRVLSLDSGIYATTGTSLGLLHGFSVLADGGSYAVTGTDVGLLVDRVLSLDSGAYTLTGTAVGLTDSASVGVDSGGYSVTGTSVGLFVDRQITLASGSYSVSGMTLGTLYDRTLAIDSGVYTLTGTSVGVFAGSVITTDTDSYLVTGSPVDILYDRVLSLDSGSYTATGTAVTLTYSGTPVVIAFGKYLIGVAKENRIITVLG